ncbi:hypothetical protein B0H17DRAFT_894777, partial [Mycena rosella]
LVSTRCYWLCVNKLEELVLKRLFKLTKMNMSQTSYKLQKHVTKAALARYNKAAAALTPKWCSLTWNEVVECTFLSDFNILHDPTGNADLRERATPAARQLMDTFFRIQRAKEEIPWLNIEICWLVTYIRDEEIFLLQKEAEVAQTDPHLAYFIRMYCNQRGRSDATHMARLRAMEKKLGSRFTGM